jgi:hypothetical protein
MALPEQVDRALSRVLRRAAEDGAFRQRLLATPIEAIREEVGTVPPQLRIKFIEKPEDLDALIVLPDADSRRVLSTEELDYAAGGDGPEWDPNGDGGEG